MYSASAAVQTDIVKQPSVFDSFYRTPRFEIDTSNNGYAAKHFSEWQTFFDLSKLWRIVQSNLDRLSLMALVDIIYIFRCQEPGKTFKQQLQMQEQTVLSASAQARRVAPLAAQSNYLRQLLNTMVERLKKVTLQPIPGSTQMQIGGSEATSVPFYMLLAFSCVARFEHRISEQPSDAMLAEVVCQQWLPSSASAIEKEKIRKWFNDLLKFASTSLELPPAGISLASVMRAEALEAAPLILIAPRTKKAWVRHLAVDIVKTFNNFFSALGAYNDGNKRVKIGSKKRAFVKDVDHNGYAVTLEKLQGALYTNDDPKQCERFVNLCRTLVKKGKAQLLGGRHPIEGDVRQHWDMFDGLVQVSTGFQRWLCTTTAGMWDEFQSDSGIAFKNTGAAKSSAAKAKPKAQQQRVSEIMFTAKGKVQHAYVCYGYSRRHVIVEALSEASNMPVKITDQQRPEVIAAHQSVMQLVQHHGLKLPEKTRFLLKFDSQDRLAGVCLYHLAQKKEVPVQPNASGVLDVRSFRNAMESAASAGKASLQHTSDEEDNDAAAAASRSRKQHNESRHTNVAV